MRPVFPRKQTNRPGLLAEIRRSKLISSIRVIRERKETMTDTNRASDWHGETDDL